MIKINNLSKSLGNSLVINDLNLTINDQQIFGLVGINGAGKSTLLRLLSGVIKADSGLINYDNENVFDNVTIKKNIFFLNDDPYYPTNSTVSKILSFYQCFYDIDISRFTSIIDRFNLDCTKNINNFSKGMKRQLFIALALSMKVKYLLLDEAFDGLDPLCRLIFKKELNEVVEKNKMTVIISSHSLRELEDFCDSYGLLNNGKIEYNGNIDNRKDLYHKYQLAFNNEIDYSIFNELDVKYIKKTGRIVKIICVGDNELIKQKLEMLNPLLIDQLEIDFEEMFIIEVENKAYSKGGIYE